jgi:iron complex outermembrane receptor protein
MLIPYGTCAQEGASTQDNVFSLGEVVVRGQSDTINEVGTVDTVDLERIDMTNSRNISEALNTLPGVSMSSGGNKAESSITIRGFENRYVPIFYDGIPLYLPYDGYVDSGNLTTDNVSRIDVSKGVSSVLYGFNTMGGVINIVSQKPKEKLEGAYRMEFSDDSAMNGNLIVGSNQGKYYFTLGAGFTDSDGWYLSDGFDPNPNEDGDKRDNSDLKDWNAAVKFGVTPAEGHEYAVGYQTIQKEKGLPPTADPDDRARYWRFTDWNKQTFYLIGDSRLTDNLSLKTRLYRDEYYNVLDSYDDATTTTQNMRYAFHSTYDDYSYGGSMVARIKYIPKNTISTSFHYKKDVHEEQGNIGEPWGSYEQDMYSFGVEDDIKIRDNLALVLGVGYDIQDPKKAFNGTSNSEIRDAKSAFSPQAGLVLTVWEDTNIHFSVGQKTRWPTLSELYSDGLDNDFMSNPNLKEEKSTNYEVGVAKPLPNNNNISLAFFYSDLEDKIERVPIVDPVYEEQYQNIEESRFMGLEFQFVSRMIPDNTFEMHYTYLDAKNQTPGAASDKLNRIPAHKLYLSDQYVFNKWVTLFASAEYDGERYDTDADDNQVKVGDFWVANLKMIATLHKSFNLELGVKNIFDENYQMEIGHPQQGRTFFVGVQGKF